MGNSYETFSYPLGSRPRPYITHTFDPCRLGHEGHEIVALLAQTRLTENAKNGIRSLIGDASLASISNWADEVRPVRDETYNWHFVDIPKDTSGFSDERDCFLPNSRHKDAATDHHNCVVDRIETFKRFSPTAMPLGMTVSKP